MEIVKTIDNYEKQAQDFLDKTSATLTVEYSHTGKHFDSDTEERDIYNCTLKRGGRSYKFTFGQSIANSGFYYTKGKRKINIDRKHLDRKDLVSFIKRTDWDFLNNGKSDIIHKPKKPTVYDILACLTKYDPETFEDFCRALGYDTDSRSAKKTYKAVVKEYLNVCKLFTDEEIEDLQEIQ